MSASPARSVPSDEARPAFGAVGLHLAGQVHAVAALVLVLTLACLDIKISATVILALEGASMMLVIIACRSSPSHSRWQPYSR
jgi:hypothetical protein